MTDDYDDELVTSHSDENPELNQSGGERKPMILPSNEGSAVSELYSKDRQARSKGWLGITEEEAQHVTEYEDSAGNFYYQD